jgi:hypothetical protein
MTMRDPDLRDPDVRDHTTVRNRNASPWGWIAGAIVVVLLLAAIAYSWNSEPTSSASNNPGASAPASTTGSAPARTPSPNTPPANAPAR